MPRIHERTLDLTAGSGPLMEPGDILHVPRNEPWVEVMGRVRNPGFYAHHSDWDVDDYIESAGGYGQHADYGKTMLSMGRFGEVVYAEDTDLVAPGTWSGCRRRSGKGSADGAGHRGGGGGSHDPPGGPGTHAMSDQRPRRGRRRPAGRRSSARSSRSRALRQEKPPDSWRTSRR
jgi:hypothetical protein